jgi:hypothetical protein
MFVPNVNMVCISVNNLINYVVGTRQKAVTNSTERGNPYVPAIGTTLKCMDDPAKADTHRHTGSIRLTRLSLEKIVLKFMKVLKHILVAFCLRSAQLVNEA